MGSMAEGAGAVWAAVTCAGWVSCAVRRTRIHYLSKQQHFQEHLHRQTHGRGVREGLVRSSAMHEPSEPTRGKYRFCGCAAAQDGGVVCSLMGLAAVSEQRSS